MLNRLYIRNYALIDSLDISFGKGLNLLTGETGAGKSIIMGALSLILGQRAENRLLFDESKKCIIEGYFDVSLYGLTTFFDEYNLDFEPETILRREFSLDGKSRAFINDTPVTLQVLKALAECLIDIHSQHATLQVSDTGFQLLVLDSVAGSLVLRKEFADALNAYKDTKSRMHLLEEQAEQAAAELDYKQFLCDELESARLETGETERLEQERDQLEHAEDIRAGLSGTLQALQEQESNAEQLIRESLIQLGRSSRYMPSLQSQEERLRSCLIEIKDLADELSATAQSISIDRHRLGYVHERLGQLYSLQQKHRVVTGDELIARHAELAQQLDSSSQDQEQIALLKKECASLEEGLRMLAAQLREGRKRAIPLLTGSVLTTLERVGMPESKLEVILETLGDGQFRQDGGDQVTYLFSSNNGQVPQPVGRVASGGELSRLMLSIKKLIAEHTALPTIIFDEIDTGISGEVAIRVGDLLEELGQRMQVIAISHLPQIAARGQTHYKVFKTQETARTTTNIQALDQDGRIREIAQMLSGSHPGEAAISHARALLGL